MKDTEDEIKGIVASRTVCSWDRISQYLACPQASSATDVLLVYTASLQKIKHEYRSFFHICTVHPSINKVFYYQLMHKRIVFREVLKFTLKLQ